MTPRTQWFEHICTACGEPCDIDDGSVEPELMARAIRSPFPPSSACCGTDFERYDEVTGFVCEGTFGCRVTAGTWRVEDALAAGWSREYESINEHGDIGPSWYCPDCLAKL